jgi:hypothetical protein
MALFQNPTSFFMERLQGGIEVHNKTNVFFSVFKRPNYCKITGLKFHAKSILLEREWQLETNFLQLPCCSIVSLNWWVYRSALLHYIEGDQ